MTSLMVFFLFWLQWTVQPYPSEGSSLDLNSEINDNHVRGDNTDSATVNLDGSAEYPRISNAKMDFANSALDKYTDDASEPIISTFKLADKENHVPSWRFIPDLPDKGKPDELPCKGGRTPFCCFYFNALMRYHLCQTQQQLRDAGQMCGARGSRVSPTDIPWYSRWVCCFGVDGHGDGIGCQDINGQEPDFIPGVPGIPNIFENVPKVFPNLEKPAPI